MHAKPDLRVFLKWLIAGSGSVITDVIVLNVRLAMFEELLLHSIENGEFDAPELTFASTQEFLIRFNHEVDDLIQLHGVNDIGNAIWYMYGCLGDFARDALDTSVADGFSQFYESLEILYDRGFAKYCSPESGHFNKLETACYMMWDMDSGLEYLSFNDRPELFTLAENLINFGLSHRHPSVQESFLHCLGHLEYKLPEFVHDKIDTFLFRRDVTSEMREYAKTARVGAVL